MTATNIEHRVIRDFKSWVRSAPTHLTKQIGQIADSVEQFGFTNPVLVNEAGTILAGDGRVEAAEFLGIRDAPLSTL